MLLASAEATEQLGRRTAAALRVGDVVALFGELGAGKTTFARGLVHGLGFGGDVASPTFPIIQVYEPPDVRLPLWHVDLYRITDWAELDELGLEDGRADAALAIEWPERLGARLWSDSLDLHLAVGPGQGRALTAKVPPAWEGRWPPR
ncbi:MAG TPA: tRNA (adenosine(37)-N6)-threonylcarbamoyltransferase complex ATPase subunit type 1 TsaE [Allosphingosinicella sp.]|nr:tRNA (adenosine(37)-N6)-threonylcarbamoyltransferase complex ATPase subunit type 1 TsaE [Allosphingosinicella sp.]